MDSREDIRLKPSQPRRLARDFERYAATVAAFVRPAMIRIMLRRLAANASSCIQTFRMRSKTGTYATGDYWNVTDRTVLHSGRFDLSSQRSSGLA
jgi:hypothetical protein